MKEAIFFDKNLSKPIPSKILYEGREYYLDTGFLSSKYKKQLLEDKRISNFLTFLPQNRIGTLKFINVIGIVNIAGTNYDIRSTKFLAHLNGNEQFQMLLNEINKMSKGLTFRYGGASRTFREVDRKDVYPALLERFNYFYQLVFLLPHPKRLNTLITAITENPHNKLFTSERNVELSHAKKINSKAITSAIKGKAYATLPKTNELNYTKLAKSIYEKSGQRLFPTIFPVQHRFNSIDTDENRFVKFFLEEIQAICHTLINLSNNNEDNLVKEVKMVQSVISRLIQLPFFNEIGKLNYLPESSSVLIARAGYKEIHFHYLQSKLGFKNVLDNLRNELTVELKKIDALYEIWAFYKVALCFLGSIVTVKKGGRIFKEGRIHHGFSWSDNNFEIFYNLIYLRSNQGSYSLRLRPDITVTSFFNKENRILFDAKYKLREVQKSYSPEEDESFYRVFKAEDIHKMHCYLDAIPLAKSAFILYPGNEFIFFQKGTGKKITNISKNPIDFIGVGAIPLLPVSEDQSLHNVVENIKL